MDHLTPNERSENMRRVRSVNTSFELRVRRLLHALGYRFRVHAALPGKPDIAFIKRRKVIFCHGCFWHSHQGCKRASVPKSKADFWIPKLARNQQRDQTAQDSLRGQGWEVLVIWECESKDLPSLSTLLQAFLGPSRFISGTKQEHVIALPAYSAK